MKKLLLATAIVTLAVSAQAVETKQYVSLKANYTSMKNDFKSEGEKTKLNDKVFGGSFAYGWKLGDARTEIETNISEPGKKKILEDDDVIKTTVHADSIMLNGYYDIPTGIAVRPYVGAGMGLARIKNTIKWTPDPEDNDPGKFKMRKNNKFVYQLSAGVSYDLTQNWALDAGYRYADFGSISKTDEDGKNKLSIKTHNYYLGARYTF